MSDLPRRSGICIYVFNTLDKESLVITKRVHMSGNPSVSVLLFTEGSGAKLRSLVTKTNYCTNRTMTTQRQWKWSDKPSPSLTHTNVLQDTPHACTQFLRACGTTCPGLAWQGSCAEAPLNLNEKLQSKRHIHNIFYIFSLYSAWTFATSKETQNQYSVPMLSDTQGYNCIPSIYQLWRRHWT